MFKTTETVK